MFLITQTEEGMDKSVFKEIYGIITLSVIALLVIVIVVTNGLSALRLQEVQSQLENVKGQADEQEKLAEENKNLSQQLQALEDENQQLRQELEQAQANEETIQQLNQQVQELQNTGVFYKNAYEGYRMAFDRLRNLSRVTGTYNGYIENRTDAVDLLEDNRQYYFYDDVIKDTFESSIKKGDTVTLLYASAWGRNRIIGFYKENE